MKRPQSNTTPMSTSTRAPDSADPPAPRVGASGAVALLSNEKPHITEEVAMRILHTSPTRGPDPRISEQDAEARKGCCAKDAFRVAFGVIWLIDAFFKWRPGFINGFHDMVQGASQGQPSWLHWFYNFTNSVFLPHPHVWAYSVAALETLIGLALVFGFARKATYILTFLTGLGIWAVAEGFGGPYTSSSTDIGAAVMYAVVALGLLALNYEAGPSRFSVDYLIEQRLPWWHRVAEVEGRRGKTAPTKQPRTQIGRSPVAT